MTDINQAITHEIDPLGHVEGMMLDWTEDKAKDIAAAEGLTLGPAHWAVIGFLRDQYREQGMPASAGWLIRKLETRFAPQGGKKHLYALFPAGPVGQGCRIAGLPLPPHTRDESFGISH